jgi:hypothetical protein
LNKANLKSLDLIDVEYPNSDEPFLSGLVHGVRSLTSLNLDYTLIKDRAGILLEHLGTNQNCDLTNLSMRYCQIGTRGVDRISSYLIKSSTIISVNLCGNTIRVSEAVISSATLKSIDLAFNEIDGIDSLVHFCSLVSTSKIECVNLSGNFFDIDGIKLY